METHELGGDPTPRKQATWHCPSSALVPLLVCRYGGRESHCATEAHLGSSGVNVEDGGGHQMMTARVRFLGVVAVVASRSARSGVKEVER